MVDPQAVPALVPGTPPPPEGSELVDWITNSTRRDRTIMSAIPPTYARYATIVIPDGDLAKTRADAALVEVLQAHTPAQPRHCASSCRRSAARKRWTGSCPSRTSRRTRASTSRCS